MQTGTNSRICIHSLFVFAFVASLLSISEQCDAQHFVGRWRRDTRIQNRQRLFQRNREPVAMPASAVEADPAVQSSAHANAPDSGSFNGNSFKRISAKDYDPRFWRDADADSRYPKFIGGFHSSHFSNIGVPSGDIGFRGNGIYWTPW